LPFGAIWGRTFYGVFSAIWEPFGEAIWGRTFYGVFSVAIWGRTFYGVFSETTEPYYRLLQKGLCKDFSL